MCAEFNSFSWYIQSHRCYSHLRLLLVYRMLLLGSSRLHFKHISGESYDGKCSMSESSLCLVLRLVAGIRTIDWKTFEHSDRGYRPKTLSLRLLPNVRECEHERMCVCVCCGFVRLLKRHSFIHITISWAKTWQVPMLTLSQIYTTFWHFGGPIPIFAHITR